LHHVNQKLILRLTVQKCRASVHCACVTTYTTTNKKLSYRKQIARQLRKQYVDG